MTINQILKAKADILTSADLELFEGVQSTNTALFNEIVKILKELEVKDGKLVRSQLNKTLTKTLTKKIMEVINASTLPRKVGLFVRNFDKLDELNKEIYESLGDIKLTQKIQDEISLLRSLQVDKVTDGILDEANLNANFINPVRDILTNGIVTQSKVTDIQSAIGFFVKGRNGTGKLTRYSRQIALDALNQHDGQVNDLIRDNYKLTHFVYINPLVKDSRKNCVELSKGTGIFSKFVAFKSSVPVYRVSDIPAILRAARKGKGSGYNEAVTAETFATYRFGYNCNHTVIYLTEEDAKDF